MGEWTGLLSGCCIHPVFGSGLWIAHSSTNPITKFGGFLKVGLPFWCFCGLEFSIQGVGFIVCGWSP